MALVVNDRVKETTTTTGTGTVTLGGAVSGFDTFAAGIGNSNTTYYCIQLGAEFEVGLGTLAGDSSTLARTTVISSSNSDNAVNFSAGAKNVFCTLPASKATVLDASGNLALAGAIDVDGITNLDVVDIDGAVDMASTLQVDGVLTTTATQVATGGITSGSNIVSDTDSTDDLGTTSVRWANLFVDGITATDQITATGFTGTLDGILGSGAAAAATTTTLASSTITASGIVTANAKLDLNGTELILDADADTSITADTDDQIDFRIGGADKMEMNATAFSGGAIYENADDIAANYSITAGKNAFSVGPITIASGVTVTVPSGQRWVIL
jgi:hypothetical protein